MNNKYIQIGKAIQKAIDKGKAIKNIKLYAGDSYGEDIFFEEEDLEELIKWSESEDN